MAWTDEEPLLDVRGVTLQYKTRDHLVTATYRVDFRVFRSDRFVLLGPSGCGESTLLKAVGGCLQRVEGEITLKGRLMERPPSTGMSAPVTHSDSSEASHTAA